MTNIGRFQLNKRAWKSITPVHWKYNEYARIVKLNLHLFNSVTRPISKELKRLGV